MRTAAENLRRRQAAEGGFVVITAVLLMAIMLLIGLAALRIVDTQAKQSGTERMRESAFNMAEGLLTAQAKVLQGSWPTKPQCAGDLSGCALPVVRCTRANAATYPNQCPNPDEIAALFKNVDADNIVTDWSVQVRDDRTCANLTAPIYFQGTGDPACGTGNPGGVDATNTGCTDASSGAAVCAYDYNGGTRNRRLWVRVDVTYVPPGLQGVAGAVPKTRSIVALLQLELIPIQISGGAVTAGAVNFSNAGNKAIVDATGSQITVRCHAVPSTTLTSVFSNAGLVVSVDDGDVTHFPAGRKLVILGANAETLTVASAVALNGDTVITFAAPGALKPHVVGEQIVRAPGSDNTCENWLPPSGNFTGQLTPQYNFVENDQAPIGISASTLQLIENSPDTTVYPAGQCPANTTQAWTGFIVITSAPAGGCSMATSGSGAINTSTSPGLLIVKNQASGANKPALTIPNNTTFFGLVYMVNAQNSPASGFDPVLSVGANAQICGGVAVDGAGRVEIGQANNGNSAVFCNGHQTGASIIYDPKAFNPPGAGGAAGLVQNTWRELVAGQ